MLPEIRLKHATASNFEPDGKGQLAHRKKNIVRVSTMIQRLPDQTLEKFFQLSSMIILDRLSKNDLMSEAAQIFLRRDLPHRRGDLWLLLSDCWEPGEKRLLWFFPLVSAWILREVLPSQLKGEVNFGLLGELWPRGKESLTFTQILDCLPEAIRMKASYHGPPGQFSNEEMLIAFQNASILQDGSIDFTGQLETFLAQIPNLPRLLQRCNEERVPASFVYEVAMDSVYDIDGYLIAHQSKLPSLRSSEYTLAFVLMRSYVRNENQTLLVRDNWAQSSGGIAWHEDIHARLLTQLDTKEQMLYIAACQSVKMWGCDVPVVPHISDDQETELVKSLLEEVLARRRRDISTMMLATSLD